MIVLFDIGCYSGILSCANIIRVEIPYIPGLTSQRHSALISSDSEYFQVCFSAVQYLKICEQRWFSLKQRWTALIFELFRMTIFVFFFTFFKIFLSTSISRHIIPVSSLIYEKKWETIIHFCIFEQANDPTHT